MPKTLSGKVSAIYSMLILFILAIGVAATISLRQVSSMVDTFIEQNYKSIQAADEMLEIVDRQDSAALSYLALDQAFGRKVFDESAERFDQWMEVIQARVHDPVTAARADNLEAKGLEYQSEFSRMSKAFDSGEQDQAHATYQADMVETFTTLKDDLRFVRDQNIRQMYERRDYASRTSFVLIVVLLALTLLFAAGGFVLALQNVRQFLNPLKQLVTSIQQVGEGQFDHLLHTNSTGELAILEANFNRMLERLRDYDKTNVGWLLAERQKLALVLDNMEDLLMILDEEHRLETVNPAACAYFQLERQECEGKPFEQVISQPAILEFVSAFTGARQAKLVELGQGQMFYLILTQVQKTAATGEKLELLMQDVTELKRTEQIRTDFIASISHELKTPMTGIVMGLSLLEEETDGANADVVEVIKEDSQRLQELIDQLVSICRLQNEEASYRLQTHAPWVLAEQAAGRFCDLARLRGIDVVSRVGRDLPVVLADGEKIGWVLNNLVGNAMKYTGIDDVIALGARAGAEFVTFYVEDNGAGIPPEYLDKLFYMIFHPPEDTVVEYRGSGIGLYLCQKIVGAHGGKIWAENRPEGGSRFLFTLPRYDRREDG